MRNFLYALILFVLGTWAPNISAQYSWKNLGPDNLGSKTRALAFNSNGNLLAGSEGGGLWISDNEGLSWKRLPTYNGNPNITSIAVNGSNIYVATGATQLFRSPYEALLGSNYNISNTPEGFIGYTGLPGGGVYISTDNGATWSNDNGSQILGVENYQGPFIGIQKIAIGGNGRIFVATRNGLFYSDDPELKVLLPVQGSTRFRQNTVYDVEIADANVVLAGTADSIYISTNGGINFQDIKDPGLYTLGRLSFQRVAIAVAPSNPKVIYVAGTRSNGELSGIWRSDDTGQTWQNYAPSGNPGFTPLGTEGRDAFTLEVFPQNPDEVIVAGRIWYTFSSKRGWTQTAQSFNPTASDFIPSKVYSVAFHPNDPQTLFVGTEKQIVLSKDGGLTFSQRTKGYEASLTYSVSSIPVKDQESVISGTPGNGVIFNRNFNSGLPSAQGFGDISSVNNGNVDASYIYPGSIVIQGGDNGLRRSPSFGTAFESFYGFPISPGAGGITGSDTIVDRASPNDEGSGLGDRDGPSMMPWVLDEVIPISFIDEQKKKTDIQKLENYIFFCSKQYVWRISFPLGNPNGLLPRWNRLTNALTSGSEFFTAITVSGDETHSLYVGTSKGNLYRIVNPHELEGFDVSTNIVKLNNPSNPLPTGRWISSISVDPQKPERVLVTYAGYGGSISSFPSLIYMADNIAAGFFLPVSGIPKEPIYTSKFVVDPNTKESILLFGSESGLYSARNLSVAGAQITAEFGEEVGRVPVYDIHVRKYLANIIDEETQDFFLTSDNTVFVATHGRGIWSTESLKSNRKGIEQPAVELSDRTTINLYPNPTSGEAYLYLGLLEEAKVKVDVFGLDGRQVSQQIEDNLLEGNHDLVLPTAKLSAGIYLVRINLQHKNATKEKRLKLVIRE